MLRHCMCAVAFRVLGIRNNGFERGEFVLHCWQDRTQNGFPWRYYYGGRSEVQRTSTFCYCTANIWNLTNKDILLHAGNTDTSCDGEFCFCLSRVWASFSVTVFKLIRVYIAHFTVINIYKAKMKSIIPPGIMYSCWP